MVIQINELKLRKISPEERRNNANWDFALFFLSGQLGNLFYIQDAISRDNRGVEVFKNLDTYTYMVGFGAFIFMIYNSIRANLRR